MIQAEHIAPIETGAVLAAARHGKTIIVETCIDAQREAVVNLQGYIRISRRIAALQHGIDSAEGIAAQAIEIGLQNSEVDRILRLKLHLALEKIAGEPAIAFNLDLPQLVDGDDRLHRSAIDVLFGKGDIDDRQIMRAVPIQHRL